MKVRSDIDESEKYLKALVLLKEKMVFNRRTHSRILQAERSADLWETASINQAVLVT